MVTALTGTNPDRFAEERLRGMTLDLGFARLDLGGDLEVGIVDVPGHERYVHNMLAGASGMDVVLLAIAANEGVMPQTREHLAILRHLNVRGIVVALTKADLLAADDLEVARAATVEALRGTIAEGAPILAVSSTTGEGLDALRGRLAEMLRALAPRRAQMPAYLPIDRAFHLNGIGTVVTGTLLQGRIALGERLRLQPSGRDVRVRSLQVFGVPRESVDAGTRVAINVPGIERTSVKRGDVVADRSFAPRASARVLFTPEDAALGLLRRRTPVRAFVGSAEILGTLVFSDAAPTRAVVGEADLHLREPTLLFPGLRFAIRRVSPKTLLGGGEVVGESAGAPIDGIDESQAAVLHVVRSAGYAGAGVASLAAALNLREDAVQRDIERLVARAEVVVLARPTGFIAASAANELLVRAGEALQATQAAEPWSLGMTSLALARTLGVDESALVRVLTALVDDGALAKRVGYYATCDHRPRLTAEQRELFAGLVPLVAGEPFVPQPFATVVAAVRSSRIVGATKAFETALAQGALVKVGDDLYHGVQIAQLRARLETFFRDRARIAASEFRDLLGTSRKYAVPMLEWLDAQGITLRDGDYRTLRKKETA